MDAVKEMAKLHDEWTGDDYSGSSIRGRNQGLLSQRRLSRARCAVSAKKTSSIGTLTVDQAKQARNNFRAWLLLSAAPHSTSTTTPRLAQAGVVIVSADVLQRLDQPAKGRDHPEHPYAGRARVHSRGLRPFRWIHHPEFLGQELGAASPAKQGWDTGPTGTGPTTLLMPGSLGLAVPTPTAFELTRMRSQSRPGRDTLPTASGTTRRGARTSSATSCTRQQRAAG